MGGGGIQLKKIAGKIMTQGLVPKLIEGGGMSLNIEVFKKQEIQSNG